MEMVVVMGIIALLMLLSASAFVLVRDQNIADQTAEELLSTIREAQNKAVSVSKNGELETKVWGVEVSSNNFSLIALSPENTTLAQTDIKSDVNPQNTTIKITDGNGATIDGAVAITYNTPFARSFSYNGTCAWVKSQRPTEEWEPVSSCDVLTGNEMYRFEIERNGHTTAVIIKANGDARIE